MPRHGGGVLAGEGKVLQPVLGEERGVREPLPATLRVGEELPVDEVERQTAARRSTSPRQ